MEKPSFKSSPWIRGAPHRVFSRDIRRTRWRISLDTGGRPGFLRRDFHVQKSLNPLRCQPMTVSGLTITRAWRQPGHRQDRMTQKTLSAFRSDGRGLFRFRTATCCRRARISVWSAARSAKISMILCMPERVSGGDAKFQGFCDRWNKWEGQPVSGVSVAGVADIPAVPNAAASSSPSRAQCQTDLPPLAGSDHQHGRPAERADIRSTVYILPPSISKKIEGYRWQSFTPPAAGKSRRFRGLICHRRSQL